MNEPMAPSEDGREYEAFAKNNDGPDTYTALVMMSESMVEEYSRPNDPRRELDEAVNAGALVRGVLDGKEIRVTRVEVVIV